MIRSGELYRKPLVLVVDDQEINSLAAMVGEITEEYRPETGRRLSDAEVKAKLEDVYAAFDKTIAGIREYQTI